MANAAGLGSVRQGSLRELNLALLLRTIAESPQPPSRADLAGHTGLARPTVSALVEDLIRAGLVVQAPPIPRSGAGRPSLGLTLNGGGPVGLGLEANVDYLAAVVVDLTGAVRHSESVHQDLRSMTPDAAFAALQAIARRAHQAVRQPLAGVALAIPGLVQGRLIRLAPNLGWTDVEVPAQFAGKPVSVDNEANLAALGELAANPSLPRSFVYVSGEVGIGAGIVVDGRVVRGARGFAGEIGHVSVHPDGPVCRCGARGCLEQYAGQDAIRLEAGRRFAEQTTPADFAALAAEGNLPMRAALERAGTALGVAVAAMVNLLDVPTVVLGGIYAPLAPWLRPPVEREIAARVLAARWSPIAVVPSVLGADAAGRGAANAALQAVYADPAGWVPTA